MNATLQLLRDRHGAEQQQLRQNNRDAAEASLRVVSLSARIDVDFQRVVSLSGRIGQEIRGTVTVVTVTVVKEILFAL